MVVSLKIVGLLLAAFLTVATAALVGGPIDANLNEEGVKDALRLAVSEHNKQSNDMYVRQVSKVIKLQKQVVSGIKYIFTVQMSRTPCRKGSAETLCEVHTDLSQAKPYTCVFEVWSQPWMGKTQLQKNNCKE